MRRAARRFGASVFAGLAAATLVLLCASSATAQTNENIPAHVNFVIGQYSPTVQDWPIVGVQVSGGLLEGQRAAVILEGANGAQLWEGEADFHAPETTIPVNQFVAVRDVVQVSLAQEGFTVASGPVITETPAVTPVPAPAAAVTPTPATEVGPGMPPEVRAQIIERPISLKPSPTIGDAAFRGSSATPRLAVSLVVLLVVFAIVFRLPLIPVGGQARVRR